MPGKRSSPSASRSRSVPSPIVKAKMGPPLAIKIRPSPEGCAATTRECEKGSSKRSFVTKPFASRSRPYSSELLLRSVQKAATRSDGPLPSATTQLPRKVESSKGWWRQPTKPCASSPTTALVSPSTSRVSGCQSTSRIS